ncbi:uncharacterized protein MCYG_02983 [Microsporum canis CBS 113480]|uniref:Uncharacterized protein n=1 Tax=Arthroderma otae (strain ATCC MYA-4605 / CBS 113480) TaxID=554155 RepID=C5FKE2_ARTOC|nr:uncharacterized protein MCYG_02983 [Microsporum canis CBS 113480]EEQ30164.1 predicted protein [Microsporum canis CBS 113480]
MGDAFRAVRAKGILTCWKDPPFFMPKLHECPNAGFPLPFPVIFGAESPKELSEEEIGLVVIDSCVFAVKIKGNILFAQGQELILNYYLYGSSCQSTRLNYLFFLIVLITESSYKMAGAEAEVLLTPISFIPQMDREVDTGVGISLPRCSNADPISPL